MVLKEANAKLAAERDEARSEASARQKDLDMLMGDKATGAERRPGVVTRDTWTAGQTAPDRKAILAANSVMEAATALNVEASDDVRSALEAAPEGVRSFLTSLSTKAVTASRAPEPPKQTAAEAILAKELAAIAAQSKALNDVLRGTTVTAAAHVPGVHARDAEPDADTAPPSGKRRRGARKEDADEVVPTPVQVQAGRAQFKPQMEMVTTKAGAQFPVSNVPIASALFDALRAGQL